MTHVTDSVTGSLASSGVSSTQVGSGTTYVPETSQGSWVPPSHEDDVILASSGALQKRKWEGSVPELGDFRSAKKLMRCHEGGDKVRDCVDMRIITNINRLRCSVWIYLSSTQKLRMRRA